MRLEPLGPSVAAHARPALLVLLGVSALVLLVACANVANLILARARDREREMAVRTALGAGRGRLLRQLLTESGLLGLLGAGTGLVLAAWSLPVLVALEPGRLPRMLDVGLDLRVMAYATIASALTALLFGVAAALNVVRRAHASAHHDRGRGIAGGRQVLRPVLVVGQLGLSLVLLAGAGLLLRSFSALLAVDPGFDPRGVLTLRLSLPDVHYRYQDQGPEIAAFYRRLDERLTRLPGVVAVGATLAPPLSGAPIRTRPYGVRAPGGEAEWGSALAHYTTVTPGWFRAVGARLVAGRFHEDQDDHERPLAVVVDQTLARKAWPRADAVGQAIRVEAFRDGRFQPAGGEVVGVVEPVHLSRLEVVEREQVYLAHAQVPQRTMFPTLRVAGDPSALVPAVQAAIEALEKDLPAFDVRLATDHVAAASALLRFSLAGLLGFAVVATTLATGGVYALLAYLVRNRRREMGIRLALGAHPRDVLTLVVRQGMTLVSCGVAAGLLGALGFTRALASMLFGVTATDALTLASVAALLLASGLLACLVPALGAARVPPSEALRSE
jgi:predicted permease